ncbi:MAG: type IV toxin-antitoxin system AbiEi family antitoxin domain-containing protein [Thermoplasmatota archaeon]
MKIKDWLDFFKKYENKRLFSFSDLLQLTDEDRNSLSVQLNRLVKSNVVNRAVKGWYKNPFNPPSLEEISMVIRFPSYLSMEYVLSKNDILSQSVYTFTLITTKKPYVYSYEGRELEYHHIKDPLFFGFEKRDSIMYAENEKALLDLLYIRYVKSKELEMEGVLSLIDDIYLDYLNKTKILEYSKMFSGKVEEVLKTIDI